MWVDAGCSRDTADSDLRNPRGGSFHGGVHESWELLPARRAESEARLQLRATLRTEMKEHSTNKNNIEVIQSDFKSSASMQLKFFSKWS